jgi:hypothetical protein
MIQHDGLLQTDHETLHEIEARQRELKAAYDTIADVLRTVEDAQVKVGIELQRWTRRLECARQENSIDEQKRLTQLQAERDLEPGYIYEPAAGWS